MKHKTLFAALIVALFTGCKVEEPEVEPVAKFSYSVNDKSVTFTNQSLNAKSYYWTFGDGSASSEMNPVKKYSSAGTYMVTLKVTNINMSSTYAQKIEVGEATKQNNPLVDFSFETIDSDARWIKFTNKSSSDLCNFLWNFGDGTTSEERSPENRYFKNGSYLVTLTAWGNNSQQKYVCEKTINIESEEPGVLSTIYVKGFKLYAIPSDGRYYKFSLIGSSTWNEKANITINTGYSEKLYISDLPRTFMLKEPRKLCQLIDLSIGFYDDLFVYVYQATNTSQSGTQCLKQTIYHGSDYSDIESGETFQYRDEYIVSSDNGQTRVGVLMGWTDD